MWFRRSPAEKSAQLQTKAIRQAIASGATPAVVLDQQLSLLAVTMTMSVIPEHVEDLLQEIPKILRERMMQMGEEGAIALGDVGEVAIEGFPPEEGPEG